MPQATNPKLDTGDRFPDLSLTMTDGTSVTLSQLAGRRWTVLLVYRGNW